MDKSRLISVLKSSLYPGAKDESIGLVLGYCEAAGLDPMLKPVHIVPMWDNNERCYRDVIMPGIGLYRTQASRTGQFAGMTEPEFGPDVSANYGGQQITHPEWCRVTVRRALVSGIMAEFTAREYWVENYAVKGGKERSLAPNAMWSKRPRGQIAKCAAAQALRIAFPELGSAPTADEMEGKPLQPDEVIQQAAPRHMGGIKPHQLEPLALEAPAELIDAAEDAALRGVESYRAFFAARSKEERRQLAARHDGLKAAAAEVDAAMPTQADETDADGVIG